jgi:hypothetical protein
LLVVCFACSCCLLVFPCFACCLLCVVVSGFFTCCCLLCLCTLLSCRPWLRFACSGLLCLLLVVASSVVA